MGLQFFVKAFDGGEGYTVCIHCTDGVIVFADAESGSKILSHRAYVSDSRGLGFVVPCSNWQSSNAFKNLATIHRLEVFLRVAVTERRPRAAAGRQLHTIGCAAGGVESDATGGADGEGVVSPGVGIIFAAGPDECTVVGGHGPVPGGKTVIASGSIELASGDGGDIAAGGVVEASGDGGGVASGSITAASGDGGRVAAGGVTFASADCSAVGAGSVVLASGDCGGFATGGVVVASADCSGVAAGGVEVASGDCGGFAAGGVIIASGDGGVESAGDVFVASGDGGGIAAGGVTAAAADGS